MQPVRATAADRDGVIRTVVAAFATDPAFRYFFPDDLTYPQLTAAFAGWLFDKRVDRGGVWVVAGGASVAMWEPPDGPHDAAPLDLPFGVLTRMTAYDHAVHEKFPDEAHWYLGVLATHPDHTGQRLGRRVLEPGLRATTAAGLPAYLETTTATNVGIYERAGWLTTATVAVGQLLVRVMRHDGLDSPAS
jgi:GNAT superfamily N-acetyltransferase